MKKSDLIEILIQDINDSEGMPVERRARWILESMIARGMSMISWDELVEHTKYPSMGLIIRNNISYGFDPEDEILAPGDTSKLVEFFNQDKHED